jgi:hypothetical protein
MLGALPHFPITGHLLPIRPRDARAYPLVSRARPTRPGPVPSMTIPSVIGVNPLQTTESQGGIVSSRVALLLRSAEI